MSDVPPDAVRLPTPLPPGAFLRQTREAIERDLDAIVPPGKTLVAVATVDDSRTVHVGAALRVGEHFRLIGDWSKAPGQRASYQARGVVVW